MAKKPSQTGHRDSKTGRFVTRTYAKRHPDTTQRESIPNPGRGNTGRGTGVETTPFDLTPEQKRLLQSLSQETGKPVPALIAEALEALQHRSQPERANRNGTPAADHKPIWEYFEEASLDIPDEELDRLPTDGSYQHDHYIYGTPKRPE
jgi:hypothetical protein